MEAGCPGYVLAAETPFLIHPNSVIYREPVKEITFLPWTVVTQTVYVLRREIDGVAECFMRELYSAEEMTYLEERGAELIETLNEFFLFVNAQAVESLRREHYKFH
ncbi:MAG: hypothetical protein AAB883_00210 [Patescibacteria group bacterium]